MLLALRTLARRARERVALALFPPKNPWQRLSLRPPVHAFGPGARHDFTWYFQGESEVSVRHLPDLLAWLRECEYISDEDSYLVSDFWQHPRTFELMRRGDCEDFALWAWRKLVEMGFEAHFVVGYASVGAQAGRRHAWVVYREGENEYLLEPCQREPEHAVRPLTEVRAFYCPEYGVDHRGRRFAFAGHAVSRTRGVRRAPDVT